MTSPHEPQGGANLTASSTEEMSASEMHVRDSLCCPHCELRLKKWQVPDSPFNEWPSEYQYVCFNDDCVYFKRGWETMTRQGNFGSYRFMFDPTTGGCHNVVVLSPSALREGIVKDAN